MNETIDAVNRVERELDAAGVARTAAIPTIYLYIAALAERSDETWNAFYRSVFERLAELADREYPFVGPAARPLLLLLDDDLGAELIPDAERARIRACLVEERRREASLPS